MAVGGQWLGSRWIGATTICPPSYDYFVAAVRTQFPEACPVTLRALQAPAPPAPEYLAELLANDLALLSQVLILVLDDYHLMRDPAVQTCMGRLLEVLPENLHLALAGRLDVSLPLSRFAARGQLCELRGDALQFTLAEATEFSQAQPGLNHGSRGGSRAARAHRGLDRRPAPSRAVPGWPGGFDWTSCAPRGSSRSPGG